MRPSLRSATLTVNTSVNDSDDDAAVTELACTVYGDKIAIHNPKIHEAVAAYAPIRECFMADNPAEWVDTIFKVVACGAGEPGRNGYRDEAIFATMN